MGLGSRALAQQARPPNVDLNDQHVAAAPKDQLACIPDRGAGRPLTALGAEPVVVGLSRRQITDGVRSRPTRHEMANKPLKNAKRCTFGVVSSISLRITI